MSIYIGATEITQSGSGLPSAYQEVEYIQSSGTQFINTGVNGTFSTSMNFDYKFTLVQNPPSGQYAILGDKNSSGQGLTMYFDYSSPGNLGTWCGSGTTYTTGSVTVGSVTTVNATFNKTQGRTIIINGTTYSNSTIANNVTTNSDTFGIGSDKGATGSSVGYFKIYYFKITKDGTLVRDFIPCYRKSDSVIGLYDLVNNQFYTNAGTGTFTKGSDISTKGIYVGTTPVKEVYVGTTKVRPKLPITYQEVEYIQSSGTQYIDTNLQVNGDFTTEVKFARSGITAWNHLFGTRDGATCRYLARNQTNDSDLAVQRNYNNTTTGSLEEWNSTSYYNDNTYVLKMNKYLYIDGTLVKTFTTSTTTGLFPYTLWIFNVNSSGTLDQSNGGYYKLYYMKIWDTNNNLARDFVPCYRKSDSVIGLYDLVNNQFYINSGTGTFSKGNDVN